MRKSKTDTAATRKLIVRTASREFRKNGVEATGVADVMHAANLTTGGFYRHFESKDNLIEESLQDALNAVLGGFKNCVTGSTGIEGIKQIVRHYLTPRKRDSYDVACPLAALGTELPRTGEQAHKIASEGVDRFIEIIQSLMTDLPPTEARAKATGILSTMVGGMVLSRISANASTANRILKESRAFASHA